MFAIYSSIPVTLTAFYGLVMDQYDNWICRILRILLLVFTIGTLMTAMATTGRSWMLYLSFSFCCFSGLVLLVYNMTKLTVANLSPKYRASITTLISGAFDSSGVSCSVFYVLYYSSWLELSNYFPRLRCLRVSAPFNRGERLPTIFLAIMSTDTGSYRVSPRQTWGNWIEKVQTRIYNITTTVIRK